MPARPGAVNEGDSGTFLSRLRRSSLGGDSGHFPSFLGIAAPPGLNSGDNPPGQSSELTASVKAMAAKADADLARANLAGANLARANLARANLAGARGNQFTKLPKGWKVDEATGLIVKADEVTA